MNRSDHCEGYNRPNETDWIPSNSAALILGTPYGTSPRSWPPPAPTDVELSATTLPEEIEAQTREALARLALIMDNMVNREEEPEDAILATSSAVQQLLVQARREPPSLDWERDLGEL